MKKIDPSVASVRSSKIPDMCHYFKKLKYNTYKKD